MIHRWTGWSVVVAVLAVVFAPTVVLAEMQLGGGAGVFVPYDGNAGVAVLGQWMVAPGEGPWRVGGEVEYRSFESKIFDVDDVDTSTIALRAVGTYRFLRDGITPYVGAGLGLAVNIVDSDFIEDRSRDVVEADDVGLGIDLQGILGLAYPLRERIELFAEFRVGANIQLTEEESRGGSDDIGVESLGGVSGIAGVRVRF